MKTRAQQFFTFILSAAFFSIGFIEPLRANPEGGTVVAGQATIEQSPGYTQINQSTDKAVINWQSFSIGAGEHTHFQQPNSNSITLNRVTGGDPSRIFGQLSANGKIILINQAGIFFGPGSSVNVAGLIASTAKMDDNDFMTGNYRFTQDPNRNAGIINYGTINAADRGLVALVAPGVENNGVIRANLGKVVLASGTEYTIDLYGDQTIQFKTGTKVSQTPVDVDGNPMKAGVANKGQIYANGGQVLLSARVAEGVVENSINMDGVVQAKSISQQNGKIILDGGDEGVTRVSGQIDVSGLNDGETGGTAKVLGKYVAVEKNAEINASGKKGGGTVLVGGNYQGKGPERNAKATYIGANTKITADAIDEGNGGKVIIWSDDATRFYGSVSANSGINGGNGGFVEISGKWLDFRPTDIQIRTVNGVGGTLLLDPNNITICNGCTTTNVDETAPPPDQIFEPDASNSTTTISDDDINFYLGAGTSVIIQTTSSGTQNGDITIQSGVSIVGSGSVDNAISFLADGSITMENGASITGNNTSINFEANAGGTPTGEFITIDGTIDVGGSIAIQNNGGGTLNVNLNEDSSITAGELVIGGDTTTNLATVLNIPSLTLVGTSEIVNVSPTAQIAQGIALTTTGGTVNLENATYDEAVTVNKAVILAGPTASGEAATVNSLASSFVMSISGNFISGGIINFGTNALTLVGDTTLQSGGTSKIDILGTLTGNSHSLTLLSQGDTNLSDVNGIGSLTTDAGGTTGLYGDFTTFTGDLTFNDLVVLNAFTVSFNNTGTQNVIFNQTVTDPLDTLNSTITGGGKIILNNGANILDYTSNSGNTILQLTGTLNINKTSGTFNPTGSIILGGDATITTAGTTDITLNAISGNYNLTLNAGDDVNFLGIASIGGVEINANLSTGLVSFGNTFTTNIGDIIVNGSQIATDGNRTLTSANDITFNTAFNSGSGAVLSASGVITLNSVTVSNTDSFTTTGSGTTVLKNNITMSTPSDVLLNTSVVTIAPTALNNTLTISGNDITIGGTLSGTGLLVLNSADSDGDHGSKSIAGGTIGSLTTNSNRTTTITGTLTSTLGDLTFNDQVVINSPVTLNSNTNSIRFNNATTALSGGGALTLNGSGDNIFGSAFTIGSLTTDSGGRTLLSHNVTSSAGDLTFNDDVIISADNLVINAGSNSVNFNDSADASTFTLTIAAGNFITLSDVTVHHLVFSTTPNTYKLKNGLTITDGTDLEFDAPVELIGNTTINKTNANITFDHTISGNYLLTLNSDHDVTFEDTVNIGGLVTNVNGETLVNTSSLTANSTGFVFNDPVTFNQATTITSNNGGDITFNTVLDSLYQLTLTANGGGSINFADVVGDLQAIANLIIGNAFNVIADKQVNVGTFVQNAGTGTTNFKTGLYASGDTSITTNAIKGNIYAQDTYLDGLSNIFVNVIVSSLTLNGKNGAEVYGTVGGYTGEFAAFVTKLSHNAIGNFVVNGCLLPGGCLANVDAADVTNAIVQENPEANKNVCTMAAANNKENAASECAGTVEIKKDELVYAN